MKNKNKHDRHPGSVKSTVSSEAYLKTTFKQKFSPVCTTVKPGDANCTDLLTSLNGLLHSNSTGSHVDSFWLKNFSQLAKRSIDLLLMAGETVPIEIEN